MSKSDSSKLIRKYTIRGLILGLLFPVLLIIIEGINYKVPFSLSAIFRLIFSNPIYIITFLVPIIIPVFSYLVGRAFLTKIRFYENAFLAETNKSEKITAFIQKLINEEVDAEYDIIDENDILGKSLIDLRNTLNKNKETDSQRRKEDEQRAWVSEGLAKFGEILRMDNDNIEELSFNIIKKLANYTEASQGGFYILQNSNKKGKDYFELTASFAYDRRKFCDQRIEWEEGLIGACALEKETIYMTDIPDSYVSITSGLGEASPRNLLIVPLLYNDELHGVIEIASFKVWEEFEIEFVEKVAESIASTISNLKINIRTTQLLKESQEQAKTLVSQEEQMRQNMEELKAMQEEAARQGEKLTSFTNSVNHTLMRAEYNLDGVLLYANTHFINKLGYSGNMEVEGRPISMFINKKDQDWFNKIWDSLTVGGKHFEGDMKHVTKHGRDLWTIAIYTCVRKEDGSPEKILFLAIDNTEQKTKSLDDKAMIDALNRSSLKAEFDSAGDLLGSNDQFAEILGYTQQEIMDKNFFDFTHVEELKQARTIWQTVTDGRPYRGEFRILSKYDDAKWLRGTLTAALDLYGELSKIIFISHDITDQKRMEIVTKKQDEQYNIREGKLQ